MDTVKCYGLPGVGMAKATSNKKLKREANIGSKKGKRRKSSTIMKKISK